MAIAALCVVVVALIVWGIADAVAWGLETSTTRAKLRGVKMKAGWSYSSPVAEAVKRLKERL